MSMTKQQRKIQDLLNQIEGHEHKEELLTLVKRKLLEVQLLNEIMNHQQLIKKQQEQQKLQL